MKVILLVGVLMIVSTTSIAGQSTDRPAVFPEDNDAALAGIKTVDAGVVIGNWLKMSDDRNRMESNIQTAFELALRRDGVAVDVAAPNYLNCRLSFAFASGLIAYAYSVEYFDFATTGVHRLLWRSSGMVTIGQNNLTADSVAKVCGDTFANAWLKWNSRR